MELEGLRGMAAIIVAGYHFILAFYAFSVFGPGNLLSPVQHMRFEDNLYGSPISVFMSGTFAVAIFFVLSGFVLSIGFFQTGRTEIIKSLASKRYLRLMLPALASVLLSYLFIKLGLSHTAEAAQITRSGWLAGMWHFSPHLFQAIHEAAISIFLTSGSPYNHVLWTMKNEFIGSFIVFGFALLFAKSNYRWILYIILILLTYRTWYLGFIIGVMLADLHALGYVQQKVRGFGVIVLGSFGLFLGGYPFASVQHTVYQYFPTFTHGINYQAFYATMGAAIVVLCVLITSQAARILSKKYISLIGKYTFSLYLVHSLVLFSFTSALFVYLSRSLNYNIAVLFSVIPSIPLVWVLTVLFEKYIDAPSIKFAKLWGSIYEGKIPLGVHERVLLIRQITSSKWMAVRDNDGVRPGSIGETEMQE
jgi:peptidoglycan/LPS O-acetylase OafA/YrhL